MSSPHLGTASRDESWAGLSSSAVCAFTQVTFIPSLSQKSASVPPAPPTLSSPRCLCRRGMERDLRPSGPQGTTKAACLHHRLARTLLIPHPLPAGRVTQTQQMTLAHFHGWAQWFPRQVFKYHYFKKKKQNKTTQQVQHFQERLGCFCPQQKGSQMTSTWTPNLQSTVTVLRASLCPTGMRSLSYKEQHCKEQRGIFFFFSPLQVYI